MRNSITFRRMWFAAFNVLLMTSLCAQKVENVRPLQLTPMLSGSFGELRATHFHSGVDFRTGGVVGIPVRCVNDGVVARIRISPVGYGNALYVEHPDGTTTVYGHLQRYNKRITEVARELQYRQENFEIDEDTKGYKLFFKKGDTIAFSGNSGSSGGPHLHFEYRNTKTENTLNPLLWYSVQDHRSPRVGALYLYSISESGCLSVPRRLIPQAAGTGKYTCGTVSVPAGKTGIGIYTTDAMDGSTGKLGVYKIAMTVKGEEQFRFTVDSCSFEQNGLVNELKDFDCYGEKGETVYQTFGNYLSGLLGVTMKDKGYITLSQGEKVPVELVVSDINGNKTHVSLTLVGAAPVAEKKGRVLEYNKSHLLKAGEYALHLDSGALLFSIPERVRVDTLTAPSGKKSHVFVAAETAIPLAKAVKLHVVGSFSDKALICQVDVRSRKRPLTTLKDSTGVYAETKILDKFVVAEDVTPPVITYLGMIPGTELRFKIEDNLSGIAKCRVEVNGKWTLCVYDAKSSRLNCSMNEPAFEKGKENRVMLTVWDAVGNQSDKTVTVKK